MGWVNDASVTNGIVSFDQLADRMLSGEWPSSVRKLQARSLGNNLRALDQGRDVGWWHRRAALTPYLASVLSMEVELVERHLRGQSESVIAQSSARSFELGELGGYRRLNMGKIELPPGLPELLHRPRRWTRHRWYAPSERLLSLVGSWMTARGVATYVAADTWTDVFAQLPMHGSVLIQCGEDVDEQHLVKLADAPELDGLSVCVASLRPEVEREPLVKPFFDLSHLIGDDPRHSWLSLPNEPLEAWRHEFIAWAVKRVPKRRRPSVEAVLAMVTRDDLVGYLHDADDLLDVVELFAVASREFTPRDTPERLAQLRARAVLIRAAASGVTGTSLLSGRLDVLLRSLYVSTLGAGKDPMTVRLTRSAWASKIPRRELPSANRETLEMLAGRDASRLDDDERELLRRAIAPKAVEVIDAIAEVGYLEKCDDDGTLRFPRRWFNYVAHRSALRLLLTSGEVKSLGRAIRYGGVFDSVVLELLRLYRLGDYKVTQRIAETKLEGVDDPDILVAFEAFIVAAGIATLVGVNPPRGLLHRCEMSAKHLLLSCEERLFPVVPLGPTSVLAAPSILSLSALATIAANNFGRLTSEDAWALTVSSRDAIKCLAASDVGDEAVLGAFRLGAKLVAVATEDRFRSLCERGGAFVWPACLVRVVRQSPKSTQGVRLDVSRSGLEKLNATPMVILSGIRAVVREDPRQYSSVIRWLWGVWSQSARLAETPPLRWLQSAPEAAGELWSHVSHDQKMPFLAELLRQRQWPEVVTRTLSDEEWLAWVELGFAELRGTFGSLSYLGFWDLVPVDILGALVGSPEVTDKAANFVVPIRVGWRRVPEMLLECVGRLPLHIALVLAILAPDGHLRRLIPIVITRSSELDGSVAAIVDWLQELMSRRPDDFEILSECRAQLLAEWTSQPAS